MSQKLDPEQLKKEYGRLIKADYELLKLHQPGAIAANGKPCGKAPIERNWPASTPLTVEQALEHRITESSNVGVRLKRLQMVVDVDLKNANGADQLTLLSEDEDLNSGLSVAPHVLTGYRSADNAPSHHYYFTITLPDDWEEGDRLVTSLTEYPGVEFKSLGAQVVAPFSEHPDSGELYEWDKTPIFPPPKLPAHIVEKLWRKKPSRTVCVEGADFTPEQLEEILAQFDVLDFKDEAKWRQLMVACNAATNKAGLDEFIAWSTQDPEYAHSAHDIAYRWDTFDPDKPGGIQVGTLKLIAREHGIEQMPFTAAEDFAGLDGDETAELAVPPSLMKQMSEQYMLINDNGKVRVFSEDYITTLGRKLWQQMSLYDFRAFHNDTLVEMPNEKKPIPAGDAWLGWSGKQKYRGLSFEPEHPPGPLPDGKFNMWTGFSLQPSGKGDWSMLEELILVALADGNEDHRDYILDWMARSVQFPHLPGAVAVAFKGGKGTGKGTLGRAWTKIFGRHGLPISSQGLLTGRFNNHLKDTVALFADEAVWGGDKAGESVFKALITEPILAYEAKGKDIEQGRNCIHIMAASNAEWTVPAGSDNERRYAVFNVAGSHVVKPGPEGWKMRDWYNKLNSQLDNGGLAGFLSALQQRDIKQFDPFNDRPATQGLADQILRGLSTTHEHVFIYGVLNGTLPEDTGGQVDQVGGLIIPKKHFIVAMEMVEKKRLYLQHSPAHQTVKWFFDDLLNKTGVRIHERKPTVEGRQQNSWIFPDIATCRLMVAKYLGYSIEDLPSVSLDNWGDKAEPSLTISNDEMCS